MKSIGSSRSPMFYKKDVLKNFANKKSKKTLQRRCFAVKFVKFLRAYFFTELLRWLLLKHVGKLSSHKCQFSDSAMNKDCTKVE